MINASDIFLKYGDRVLLNRIGFVIGEKDKIGLVGRNGAGKTTLLKIISREMSPDDGKISFPKQATLAYLRQEMDLPKGRTVMEEALSAFEETKKLETQIIQLNQELAERTDYESQAYAKLLEKLSTATDRFEILGGPKYGGQRRKDPQRIGF